MISTAPLFSMSAFIIVFIALLLIGRALSEYKHNKSPQDVGRRQASASQKTLQRYYNTRIGA